MSRLSEWFEKRFKARLREWLVRDGVAYVMGVALFSGWLKTQPAEVQAAAPDVLQKAFELVADKWLGG